MTVENNAKTIRRELLAKLSSLILAQQDYTPANRIPIDMRPRKGKHVRCCVHRDRAVIRYKILGMLGIDGNHEEDELKTISSYFEESLANPIDSENLLTVVDEACSSCQKTNYVVTNMCQGCVGRPCEMNCPKQAIALTENNQAKINVHTCVNCGICEKVCPFHAIIYSPVPCEVVCPVNAIQKDEDGKEVIDMDKCVLCGKCISACPFGAIIEKSDLFHLIHGLAAGQQHIALVAPALAGQLREGMDKIAGSLHALGFSHIYEVALGADITSKNEALEFKEKIAEGESMTTSCCPAYLNTIEKHAPELKHFVSTTRTPMQYTAALVREKHPEARIVFIGPCIAKKSEALRTEEVDLVINFEEYNAWLQAANISVSECSTYPIYTNISSNARNYAWSGGVSQAVAAEIPSVDFQNIQFDGIDKNFLRKLKSSLKSQQPTLVEVMACEGGCIAGCNAIVTPKAAKRQLDLFVKSMEKKMHTLKSFRNGFLP